MEVLQIEVKVQGNPDLDENFAFYWTPETALRVGIGSSWMFSLERLQKLKLLGMYLEMLSPEERWHFTCKAFARHGVATVHGLESNIVTVSLIEDASQTSSSTVDIIDLCYQHIIPAVAKSA